MACIILPRDIGGIEVDVVIAEDATSEMEIPEHPVEKGAKVSDHAWRKPEVINIEAANEDQAQSGYDAFRHVQDAAEPFDFLSGWTLHSNMLIQTLNPSRDVETGQIFNFRCTLKEVIIVETQEGQSTQGKAGGKDGDERGQSSTNRGQVQAVETSGESALARMQAL